MEAEDLHEWVSFEDPDELRTWVFDLTFLLSNWQQVTNGKMNNGNWNQCCMMALMDPWVD